MYLQLSSQSRTDLVLKREQKVTAYAIEGTEGEKRDKGTLLKFLDINLYPRPVSHPKTLLENINVLLQFMTSRFHRLSSQNVSSIG